MKQRINREQLDELSEIDQTKLLEWLAQSGHFKTCGKEWCYYHAEENSKDQILLNIGQLIEYINYKLDLGELIFTPMEDDTWEIYIYSAQPRIRLTFEGKEIVDALWEIVKYILGDFKYPPS